MATNICCQLVGDLIIDVNGCLTSINVSSSTETFEDCETVQFGPTIGTISITAYANRNIYIGCPSQAGVSINWIRKYDCDRNISYFLKSGEGQSFISGETAGLVSISRSTGRSYPVISASSTSGPASIYMKTYREDGYGMTFTGDPFPFDTSKSLVFPNFGVGEGLLYLQSFNLNLEPGNFPTVNYSFLFAVTD